MALIEPQNLESTLLKIIAEDVEKLNIGQIVQLLNSLRFSTSQKEIHLLLQLLHRVKSDTNISTAVLNLKFVKLKSVNDFKLAIIINYTKWFDDPWICFFLLKSFVTKDYSFIPTNRLVPLVNRLLRYRTSFMKLLIDVVSAGRACHTNNFVYCLLNVKPELFNHISQNSREILFNTFEEYIKEQVWTPKQLIPRFGTYINKAAEFILKHKNELVISEYLKRNISQNDIYLVEKKYIDVDNLVINQLRNKNEILTFVKSVKNPKVRLQILKTLLKTVTRYLFWTVISEKPDLNTASSFSSTFHQLLDHVKIDASGKLLSLAYLRGCQLVQHKHDFNNLYEDFLSFKEPRVFKKTQNETYISSMIIEIQAIKRTGSYQSIGENLHMFPLGLHILKAYLKIYKDSSTKNSTYNPEALEKGLQQFISDYSIFVDERSLKELRMLGNILELTLMLKNTAFDDNVKRSVLDSFIIDNSDIIFLYPKELISIYMLSVIYKDNINELVGILSQPLSIILPSGFCSNTIKVPVKILTSYHSTSNGLSVSVESLSEKFDHSIFSVGVKTMDEMSEEIIKKSIKLTKGKPEIIRCIIPVLRQNLEVAVYMELPDGLILIKRSFVSI